MAFIGVLVGIGVGLAPGIALVLVVIGCTLVADGVRERR